MNKKFYLIIGLAVLVFAGLVTALIYNTPPPPPVRAVAQHHLTVLLDLSDRIGAKKGGTAQASRDLQDLKAVLVTFKKQVKDNFYVNSRDQLAVVVSRQRDSNPAAMADHQADFTIDMAALPINKKQRKQVDAATDSLYLQAEQLYAQAQANQAFTGADIWSFFDQELPLFLLPSKATAHDSIIQTLVIITDGYNDFQEQILKTRPFNGNRTSFGQVHRLAHKPDPLGTFDKEDYGLMATQKYPGLRVLVLELAPDGNDATQGQLIRKYWNKWFDEMGIATDHRQLMLNNASPSLVQKALEQVMHAPIHSGSAVATLK